MQEKNEKLYHFKKNTSNNYSYHPSGILSVPRLMAEKPYFKKTTLSQQEEKNSIVVSDWTLKNWNENELNELLISLEKLKQEGFPVYLWQKGELIPFEANLFQKLIENITPASLAEIHFSASQKSSHHNPIPVSELYVLDNLEIHNFLDHKIPEGAIDAKYYGEISEAIIKDLHKLNKPITKVLCTVFPKYIYSAIKLSNKMEIPIEFSFDTLVLEESLLSELLEKNSLTYSDTTYSFSDFSSVKDLTIKGVKLEELGNLLKKVHNLKKLNLANCSDLESIINIEAPLKSLETLNFSASEISSESLSHILKKAPHLKHLDLSNGFKITELINIEGTLDSLETLNFSASEISDESLSHMLKKTPHLKHLDLSWNDIGFIIEQPLNSLETLTLRASKISSENLSPMLKKTPHLKHLNLSYCRNFENFIIEHPLNSLETLDLSGNFISSKSLSHMLKKASHIKQLDLTNCLNLADLFIKEPLDSLETLNLKGSNISSKSLSDILKKAPHIKRLDLSTCKNLTELIKSEATLELLEIFEFNSSSVSSESLSHMLKKAPHIKHLDLKFCENINELINIEGTLDSLELLNLTWSAISTESLINILKKAPHLKHLDLSHCKNLNELVSLEGTWDSLELLNLNSSFIHTESLTKLLKKAPHLRELQLVSQNLLKINNLQTPLESLELLNLGGSTLSTESLSHILNKAPHLRVLYLTNIINLPELNIEDPLESLELIDLRWSPISSENLIKILSKAPNIKKLHLNGCGLSYNPILSEILGQLQDKGVEITGYDEAVLKDDLISPQFPSSDHSGFSYQNPSHDPKAHLERKPQENSVFEYKGTNTTKNQGMLIEKISQYLTWTDQHSDWIPQMKQGICNGLTHYAADLNLASWQEFIQETAHWDGRLETLNDTLRGHFKNLLGYLYQYQFNPTEKKTYLGDALESVLAQWPVDVPLILNNPWHAVLLKKTKDNSWFYYDPNRIDGGCFLTQQAVLRELKHSLGPIVALEGTQPSIKPIFNPSSFLEEGGLLALCQAENWEDLLKIAQTTPLERLPEAAFDGLFLRSTEGVPAYQLGLESSHVPIREFTEKLLSAYQEQHAHRATQRLKDAAAEIHSKPPAVSQPQNLPSVPAIKPVLLSPLPPPKKNRIPADLLCTWNTAKAKPSDLLAYCQELVRPMPLKKRLIELNSDAELQGLQSAVQGYCHNISRPVFYVHSPEDLVCSASRPVRIGTSFQGEVQEQAGPLYDFLKQHATSDNPPVLLVNYSQFTADDVVRFNALLDKTKERKADGVPLPSETRVIGLLNIKKPGCYRLNDFYSRFKIPEPSMQVQDLEQAITSCPLDSQLLEAQIPKLPVEAAAQKPKDCFVINLFHADNWKERLIGQWTLQGEDLIFKEGALYAAIASKKPLVIENGLWEDEEFKQFWQQALLRGLFPETNLPFEPQKQSYLRLEGYDWKALWQGVQWDANYQQGALVLNSSQTASLFQRYACKEGLLFTYEGLFEEYKNKTLHLNLTGELSEDQWAECLLQAQRFQVKLHLHYTPALGMPPTHPNYLKPPETQPLPQWDANPPSDKVQVIVSKDPDTTLALLTQKTNPDSWELNISECEASHLFESLKAESNAEKKFKFSHKPSFLMEALNQGKQIILKGDFSKELVDGLAALLLNPSWDKGCLILVTQDPKAFAFTSQSQHEVSPELQRSLLGPIKDAEWELINHPKNQSLAELQSRLIYIREHPDASPEEAWKGMKTIPQSTPLKDLDLSCSAKEAQKETQTRLNKVLQALEKKPFVYLTGLTSVGKTTFVRKHLKPISAFYENQNQIADWANNKEKKRKILFLDEANLTSRQWSEMEGLFSNPKGLFVEGVYYPLDEHHQVVFAGNPLSYGDERQLAPFFKRHGNAVWFEPLSLATVYEDLLKPLFPTEKEAALLSQPLLKVYQFLSAFSQTDVLITPRELQMMALLIRSYCEEKGPNPEQAASYYAYHLASHLVPSQHQSAFLALFQNKIPQLERPSRAKPSFPPEFLITPSRQELCEMCGDLLQLIHYRRANPNAPGGLGGLIIEGEPGIGKSELAIHLLISQGFTEKRIIPGEKPDPTPQKHFYKLPVSWTVEAKNALLLKAFHEGAVVLIDEINSAPAMEYLLNSLLMGRDLEGNPPAIPGFMIIGTQNPITMAGRSAPSTALYHRLITKTLPAYSNEEMQAILCNKGLEQDLAWDLIEDYNQKRLLAQQKGFTPAPCFRDLLSAADCLLTGSAKAQTELELNIEPSKKSLAKPETASTLNTEPFKKSAKSEKQASINYNFLFKAASAISASLSLAAIVVTVLALTAILSIGTAGIGTAIAAGALTGAASYAFYKAAIKKGRDENDSQELQDRQPDYKK